MTVPKRPTREDRLRRLMALSREIEVRTTAQAARQPPAHPREGGDPS